MPESTASDAPLPTVTAAETPTSTPSASAGTRVSSADKVFSVEMPAGWTQNPTSDPSISSITLNAPDGGNLQILSVRYAKPATTITEQFSRQRNAIVAAFPNCKFPSGAEVIKESLGGKMDANYRVFTCDSMPFAFTVFTANGPNGELLVGHDADFGKKADRWKDVVRSVVTAK